MKYPPLVHSISYGGDEGQFKGNPAYVNAFNVQAMKLGAMGGTIVVASGDSGVGFGTTT